MAEPTSTATATGSILAAAAAFFLELTGVELPLFVWATIGAGFMQAHSKVEVSKKRALLLVILGGFLGALIGAATSQLLHVDARVMVLLLSAVGGAGAHPIMQTLVQKMVKKVESHDA